MCVKLCQSVCVGGGGVRARILDWIHLDINENTYSNKLTLWLLCVSNWIYTMCKYRSPRVSIWIYIFPICYHLNQEYIHFI